MKFLAQFDPSSVPSLVIFIVGGSAAIFLINQVLTFWKDHMREQPAPADTYATKSEHTELKDRVRTVETAVDENFRELDRKRSVSIAGLHDDLTAKTDALRKDMKDDNERLNVRITEVLSRVSELKGELKGINR